MRILVVGGVAGGMSFAARARRLDESAEIVVFERDPYVSFANCGLPYYVAREIVERDDLLLHTPESLAASLKLDVRVGHEVRSIDPAAKTITVHTPLGTDVVERYDVLVLSTGAAPIIPPIEGLEREAVKARTHVLRNVPDVDAITALVDGGAKTAAILGAGFIGLEMAEALVNRDLHVSLVDLADQVMAPLDPEMARTVQSELTRSGVDVHLGVSATAIDDEAVNLSDGTRLPADLIVLAIGVRPESDLAAAAGLELGVRGAVRVDEHSLTSDPSIYAVGDSVEVTNAVTDQVGVVPLAGLANRQGRAAADHLFGRMSQRPAALGTAIVRVFNVTAATTGASEKVLAAQGVDYRKVYLHPNDHAGYYPGASSIHLKLLFSPEGRILGAQAVGRAGVDKRIDVIATAIRGGLTVDDLAELELAYAPPFGSAKDPINMAGFMAQNLLRGDVAFWYGEELPDLPADAVLLDVRAPREVARGALPNHLNIPHTELRERIAELPAGRPVYAYCASGFRSYLAARILTQSGYEAATLAGGMATMKAWLQIDRESAE
jgi:NADPH-dependent 2,4-dienoyl-CoA reductase/sulfur reductase-like enzyme/rhodanese-related sulfurtransferase